MGKLFYKSIIVLLFLYVLDFSGINTYAQLSSINAPILKWQYGGCYSSWCETGWYSSPAAADLDGDGTMEIIAAAYTLFALNAEDGSVQWRAKNPAESRVWPGAVVADLSGDGDLEIVIASGSGYLSVYNHQGNYESGWPKHPCSNELRSLAVGDLDNNGDLELVVGQAKLDKVNVWVYEHNGTLRSGWPQITDTEGSAAGIYNDNIGLGDLNNDGKLEVIVPSDTITIAAYDADGNALPTNTMYHNHSGHDMDYWAEVPAYIDLAYEIQGWGPCYEEFTPRANFADGPANVVDVNGDGVNEVVAIGNVHNCHTSPYTNLYNTPYILNLDRTRFNAGGFDWTTPPIDTGAPVIENYNILESVESNPVTVDLDGNGKLEILFASYDGKMHAFWLDKTEHGHWPFAVYNASDGFYRGASEPLIADLDNNGSPEVIFSSWVQKGTKQTGRLHILDASGNQLQQITLPYAYKNSADWNGVMAAPTLANIDADADMEIILNSAHSGVLAYGLPGTANARILWGTGRGSTLRNGLLPYGDLSSSYIQVNDPSPNAGDTLRFSIALHVTGITLADVSITDILPINLSYAGNLLASKGTAHELTGTITWQGEVQPGEPVTIGFDTIIDPSITYPTLIVNTITLDDGQGSQFERSAAVIVNGLLQFLPQIFR